MKRYRDPLFAPEKRRHPALGLFILLLIVLFVSVLVFNHINNNRVTLLRQSVTVPSLPSSMENFRILHISDLHGLSFGARQERLAAAFANVSYNIVCVTGDITGKDGDVSAFLSLLDAINPQIPVYFITGDEDPDPIVATPHAGQSAKADYILQCEAHGAIYLDAPQKITLGKGTLWLCPEFVYSLDVAASESALTARQKELLAQPDSPEKSAALTAVAYQLDQMERVRAARRETAESDLHIALTHHPLQAAAMENLQEWTASDNESYVRTVSLILAGHYVGGQWRLPGVGAVRAPESAGTGNGGWFPPDEKITGLSTIFGISQYISPGLGASSAIGLPGFRLINTPAVTLLTLTTKLTQ